MFSSLSFCSAWLGGDYACSAGHLKGRASARVYETGLDPAGETEKSLLKPVHEAAMGRPLQQIISQLSTSFYACRDSAPSKPAKAFFSRAVASAADHQLFETEAFPPSDATSFKASIPTWGLVDVKPPFRCSKYLTLAYHIQCLITISQSLSPIQVPLGKQSKTRQSTRPQTLESWHLTDSPTQDRNPPYTIFEKDYAGVKRLHVLYTTYRRIVPALSLAKLER
jgi:hypothetical protein